MWLLPKNLFRRAKDVTWSQERSPLLMAYRMMSERAQNGRLGVPDGSEAVIALAAERARWTWLIALAVVILGWVVMNLMSGLPFLANVVVLALLALCVVEATKYAFVAWHCRTKGTAREFLAALRQEPALLLRPPAWSDVEQG